MCLPHMSSISKKICPKTFGPHCVWTPVAQGHRRVSGQSPIERYQHTGVTSTEVLTGLAGIIGKRKEMVWWEDDRPTEREREREREIDREREKNRESEK
jgi:hypothetical protein